MNQLMSLAEVAKSKKRYVGEDVWYLVKQAQNFKDYHQRNYANSIKNWRYYFAKNPELGFGQYGVDLAAKLLAKGRQLVQYNFIKPSVDSLAGALLQVKFDPLFIPVNASMSSLTEAVQESMYSDKEMLDWNATFLELIMGGLIHEGCIKMEIFDEYDELGNIGFRPVLPGTVFSDPSWRVTRSKECRRTIREMMLLPEEIMKLCPAEADAIEHFAKKDLKDGIRYGDNTGAVPFVGADSTWGSFYRVYERNEVKETQVKTTYYITDEGPQAIPSVLTEVNDIRAWLDNSFPGWSAEHVFEKERTELINWQTLACPDLLTERVLDHSKTEIQIGGTPYPFWSAYRFNGEPLSVVDGLIDLQQGVNYDEMMQRDQMQTQTGGADFTAPYMFESNEEYLRYEQIGNKPGMKYRLKPGYMENGQLPAKPVIQSQLNPNVQNHLFGLIQNILPHISKVTPSSLGRTEQSGMSGYLFEQLRDATDTSGFTLHYGLRLFFNDLYEGYLLQAPQQYSNEMVQRVFMRAAGSKKIVLNERITLEDGTEAIRNDVSKLMEIRHKVLIAEKPETPTQQLSNVETYGKLIQMLGQNPQKAMTVSYFTQQVIKNLPHLGHEDKTKLEEIGMHELELAFWTLQGQTGQAKLAALDIMQKVEAMEISLGLKGQPIDKAANVTDLATNQISNNAPSPQEMNAPQGQGVNIQQTNPTDPQGQGVIND